MARYDGFMSYSHAADGKLAPAIQAALHALGRPWYKLRALSVFRDKTSLAADPGLWPSIEQALSNSRWFIYLASPKAAHSEWVGREVAWWLAKQDSSSLLIVVTEGTIEWDGAKNDFDWNVTDAVPAALAGKFSAEPHWVDLRWAKNQDNLSLRHSGFRDAILDVAAPLHGQPKDELDGADVRQYRRNRRTAAAAIGALVLLTTGATIAAYLAIQQSRLSSSRELAAHAVAQLDKDPELSVRLALHALDRAETLQAQEVLRRAVVESRTLYTVRAPTEVSLTRYSHDGRVIALASGRQVVLVDAATGVVRHVLPGDSALVPCVAFSEDSRLLASCGTDGAVHLWNVADGESLRWFKAAKTEVRRAQFNPTGDLLATMHELATGRMSDQSGTVDLGGSAFARIWKTATGELVAELNHGSIITDVEFDPNGHYVVTAGYDAKVKVWDARRGTLHKALSGHAGRVLAVRFSRDGRALVTVDEELIIRRWNPDTGALTASGGHRSVAANFTDATGRDAWISPGGSRAVIRTLTSIAAYDTTMGRKVYDLKDVPTSIHNAVFSDDERLLAFGGEESTIVVWDLEGDRMLAKLRGQQSGISDMGFSPDGRVLVTGGVDGTARAWDLGPRELTQLVVSHRREVTQAVWDKAGRLIASGGEDGEVIVHDTSGHRVATMVAKGRISALSFSEDGKRLLVARYDNGGAHIWDVSTGKPIVTLKGTDEPYEVLHGADYSPDERIVIAGVTDRVLRWDAESGKRLSDIPAVATRTAAKDGKPADVGDVLRGYSHKTGVACVATEVPTVSRVWDVRSGKLLTELRGHLAPVMHAGMSEDGRWIALWNGNSVEIWDLVNGRRQAVIESAGWTMSLEFNPDGTRLATTGGQADPVARVWDVRSGKLLRAFRGHANTVEHARFSPDGHLLVTASADNTVNAWLAETGQLITSFAHHRGMVFDARYSPDGTRILTASADGTAMMFDCSLCIPLDRLRAVTLQRPPRSLTPQERTDFLH